MYRCRLGRKCFLPVRIFFLLLCLQCLNVTQLLRHYGLRANTPISHNFFTYLCPALLYQIDRRLCIEHYEDLVVEDLSKGQNSSLGNMEKTGASGKGRFAMCVAEDTGPERRLLYLFLGPFVLIPFYISN